MARLTWIDDRGRTTAYAEAPAEAKGELKVEGKVIPCTLWAVPKWSYTWRVAGMISSGVPLGAITPRYTLLVDGEVVPGGSLLVPGEPLLPWTASPSFRRSVVVHLDPSTLAQSSLWSLQLGLPTLLADRKSWLSTVWSGGD